MNDQIYFIAHMEYIQVIHNSCGSKGTMFGRLRELIKERGAFSKAPPLYLQIDKEQKHELIHTHVAHMAQWVTNSGWYSHKFLTGIFLMEWRSVWQIQQSTLVLKDRLFTMPQTPLRTSRHHL